MVKLHGALLFLLSNTHATIALFGASVDTGLLVGSDFVVILASGGKEIKARICRIAILVSSKFNQMKEGCIHTFGYPWISYISPFQFSGGVKFHKDPHFGGDWYQYLGLGNLSHPVGRLQLCHRLPCMEVFSRFPTFTSAGIQK